MDLEEETLTSTEIHHDAVEPLDSTSQSRRVASLDAFRGLTVALMVLVDDAGGEWPVIGHAPWNGCNLADFVMPFFLFIVGVSIALAFKRIEDSVVAVKKVILRTLQLLFWGLLLQGGYFHSPDVLTYGVDIKRIRLCGILQRIALAYMVVAFLEIFTRKQPKSAVLNGTFSIFKNYVWHWILGCGVLIIYLATLYGVYVPDWKYKVQDESSPHYGETLTVVCNVRGKLDPPCNAVGYVDRMLLGVNHMYQHPAWRRSKACTVNSPRSGPFRTDAPSWCFAPFEPEGVLSSVSAILSTVIGVHCGHVLISMRAHLPRLRHWTSMGLGLLIVGISLHYSDAIPLNKQLYTLSYVCLTSGAAALVLSFFYVLEDVWKIRYPFLPLEWIGMNAMLVYVMAAAEIFASFVNGWYYDEPGNNLVNWIKKHIFFDVWHSKEVGTLFYVIFGEILFWAVVSGLLHHFRIYWKL